LLSRVETVPPSAGRLLALVVILPLTVWWVATGWLRLGGDAETIDPQLRLVRAVYWAVTTLCTVGYGDIVPKTTPQMAYAGAVMVTGVGFFGYVLSNVASLMLRLDAAKRHQEELRDRVEIFMQYHRIPPALRQRVRAYFQYLWASRRGYDDGEVFAGLPHNLRADLSLYLHRELLAKVPLLKDAGTEVMRDLVVALRPVVCLPGEVVFRQGALGEEMYFIVRGDVEILDAAGATVARLTDGSFFGEMALLTSKPRNATARAVDFCDLCVLDRATFERVIEHYPDFQARIEAAVRARLAGDSLVPTP
jgi:hypothetical protein